MIQTDPSPVVEGVLLTHKIISRGLTVSIQRCNEYFEKSSIPSDEVKGFSDFVSTLIRVTHAHHLSEDEIAFPYFMDLMEAPFSQLKDDHQTIAAILARMERYLSEITTDGLAGLRDTLSEFNAIWYPHIAIEEEHFTAQRVHKLVSLHDQIILVKKLGDHGRMNAGPGPLALPFMFYNLEEKDREIFIKPIPLIVTKLLVPVIWKSQWKPMRPFLLHSESN